MIDITGEEPFSPAVGMRPYMYYNPNNCGMYDLLFEAIAVCYHRTVKRMYVTLERDNGMNVGVTISTDANIFDQRRMERQGFLGTFNALYCGVSRMDFKQMELGAQFIMVSKAFELSSHGKRVKIVLPDGANASKPDERIMTQDELGCNDSTLLYWKPDFNWFHHFDGKIVVEQRVHDGWPACHYDDEDFRKSHSKRRFSDIHPETIDRDVVKTVIDYIYNMEGLNDNKPIITLG